MNRIERMAAILLLLQERQYSSEEIAKRFEVSRRTILRDVEALSEMGVPVIACGGPGGGYSLPEDYRTEPLPLTRSEVFLLLLSVRSIERLSDLPFREERASLIAKLRALLPGTELSRAEGLLKAVEVDTPIREKRAPFLETLIDAAQSEYWLRMTYQSGQRTATQHILPKQIYTQAGLWYCLAYAQEREDNRTYRVDRIQALEAPGEDFIPAPVRETLPYDHESHPRVVVRLTARGVDQMEIDRHLSGQVQRFADGSGELTFHCPPSELDWYARFFASLGAEVEVLEPGELRERLHQLGQELIARYEKR